MFVRSRVSFVDTPAPECRITPRVPGACDLIGCIDDADDTHRLSGKTPALSANSTALIMQEVCVCHAQRVYLDETFAVLNIIGQNPKSPISGEGFELFNF